MANPDHLEFLKRGATVWNQWRVAFTEVGLELRAADLSEANLREADLTGADLSEADLSGADLRGTLLNKANLNEANLRGANLLGAYFREADLRGANLSGADVNGADLHGADLSGADLSRADLREANLIVADLRGPDLHGADLHGADLTRARFAETVFADCSLGRAVGLDTCFHLGPSTIDHRTLAKSGSLPIVFLRGCGLPDRLIDYLPSLLDQPIQFYSCFISYSTKDRSFAARLHADLQNKGVRCWFAPHDIQGGKKIHEQIDDAIRVYDRLLLILSAHSMNSEWVKTEIAKARKREQHEKRQMLFPIRLVDFDTLHNWECFDADTGKDSAREIREYFIPDFSEWKTDHDHYEIALERLLKDLKPVP